MNKKELIVASAEKVGMKNKEMERALKAVIETIVETVANNEKVAVSGLGVFNSRTQAGRTGTCQLGTAKGQEWKTEDKQVPTFKAGKAFKDTVAGE